MCPFTYEPINGKLTLLTKISFTVNLKPSPEKAIHVKRRAKIAQEAYDQALRALVDNPEDIAAYQQLPDSIYDDNVTANSSTESQMQPNLPPEPPPYPLAGPLTVITSPELASSFQAFINQKAADGIRVKVVTTTQIEYYFTNGDQISNPAIDDPAGCIRQYLHDEAYLDGCTWVLLVGDQNAVPSRYVPDSYGGKIPTDLYYSDLSGNWSPGFLSPNLNPTLFVGRLPFTSSQDIATWTNKLIQYETNPFPGNTSALTKVLWSISDQMEDDGEYKQDSTTFPSSFTQTIMRESPSGHVPTDPSSPTGTQIINTLNSGYGFYIMCHHGSPDRVAVRTDTTGSWRSVAGYNGYPKWGIFSYDYLDSYAGGYNVESGNGFDNTTNNCTIVYSIACDVAAYDSTAERDGDPGITSADCMAKAWLRVPGGGPAFLGNTREGLVGSSSILEQRFLNELFNKGNVRIGQAEADSKLDDPDLFLAESHNLFGDPSMIVWTSVPSGNVAKSRAFHKDETAFENLPNEFELSQNYPNPFNPSTTIHFALPIDSHVTLKVYDMLGRVVASLVDGFESAGYHEVSFDGTKLSSGIYVYELTANNFVSVKKMVMLK